MQRLMVRFYPLDLNFPAKRVYPFCFLCSFSSVFVANFKFFKSCSFTVLMHNTCSSNIWNYQNKFLTKAQERFLSHLLCHGIKNNSILLSHLFKSFSIFIGSLDKSPKTENHIKFQAIARKSSTPKSSYFIGFS